MRQDLTLRMPAPHTGKAWTSGNRQAGKAPGSWLLGIWGMNLQVKDISVTLDFKQMKISALETYRVNSTPCLLSNKN